jgi:integrase/recombinase XerD
LLRHIVGTRLLRGAWTSPTFLGHESTEPTRIYAETSAATLQRSSDRITNPAAHDMIAEIRQRRGDAAAILAAGLLAQRRAERSAPLVHELAVLAAAKPG